MIADRRELYNDQVYRYDTRIAQVPTIVARRDPRLAAARVLPGRARRPAAPGRLARPERAASG